MTVYDSFAKQVPHEEGIQEIHIQALNELLAPGRKPTNLRALLRLQFTALLDPATKWNLPLAPGFDRHVREFEQSEKCVQRLLSEAAACESQLSELVNDLASSIDGSTLGDVPSADSCTECALKHYRLLLGVVALLKRRLERREASFAAEKRMDQTPGNDIGRSDEGPWLDEQAYFYSYLAEAVRDLIRTQDEAYRRQLLRSAGEEYIGRGEWQKMIFASLRKLNRYLANTDANFRLQFYAPPADEERIERVPVDGDPCDPLFDRIFGPFLDHYLSLPPGLRGTQLVVCRGCLAVFRRCSEDDHVSIWCPTCRSKPAAERIRHY